jgi:hypothetical protein
LTAQAALKVLLLLRKVQLIVEPVHLAHMHQFLDLQPALCVKLVAFKTYFSRLTAQTALKVILLLRKVHLIVDHVHLAPIASVRVALDAYSVKEAFHSLDGTLMIASPVCLEERRAKWALPVLLVTNVPLAASLQERPLPPVNTVVLTNSPLAFNPMSAIAVYASMWRLGSINLNNVL